ELGDVAAARRIVEQGISGDPAAIGTTGGAGGADKNDPRLVILDAELARAAGDRDRAHALLEAELARDPKAIAAWAALARLLLDEGTPAAATYVATRALAGAPGDAPATAELHEALGLAATASGDPAAAAFHLSAALAIDRSDVSAELRLGSLLLVHGAPARA